ncbi:Cell division protein ZapA, inhibits GTPase activity of FtsZ [Lampropedia hyalina DSM 16112]|jgi:cell division protein ZapA|uniref:Cell division protein ZapA, inhibits GTPase activity of FtsZ n=1 Tax=Lampropedia hyalina DSM 16112 TaxID=1122156 RepID=A0A1M4TYK2_9BURK|nr:cell division protein ZapA [Lampropedia hyalina]SHE49436.1 Cell division protein ZapA, inhibits GTPase activity of FtsZ [Lampropedia hyalina DSM 16112]
MKQVEVQILKQSYLLRCANGEEDRLLDAVQQVDAAMTRIYEEGKMRGPTDRIAVLAALHLAQDLLEVRQQLRALEQLQETGAATSVDAQPQADATVTETAEPAAQADAAAQATAEEDVATPAAAPDTDAVADANVEETADATDALAVAAPVDAEAQAAKPVAEPQNKDQDQLRALIARIDQALQKIA